MSDHDLPIRLRRVTDFFAQGHSVRLLLFPTNSQVGKCGRRVQSGCTRVPSAYPWVGLYTSDWWFTTD